MARASQHEGDHVFPGSVVFTGSMAMPAASIDDADINAAAKISASKLMHRHVITYGQLSAVDVVSETKTIYIAKNAGTVLDLEVRPDAVPTDTKQYTVDLLKATDGSGSFSSLLSSPLTVSSSSVANTLVAASLISSPVYAAGDALQIVITASGASGNQGQGFNATINLDEDPA